MPPHLEANKKQHLEHALNIRLAVIIHNMCQYLYQSNMFKTDTKEN